MENDTDKLAKPASAQQAATPVAVTDEMVNRFLTWPLPGDVAADPCAMALDYPGRTGTNLLNAHQVRAMLQHVLGG